jgi:hypothetical protein
MISFQRRNTTSPPSGAHQRAKTSSPGLPREDYCRRVSTLVLSRDPNLMDADSYPKELKSTSHPIRCTWTPDISPRRQNNSCLNDGSIRRLRRARPRSFHSPTGRRIALGGDLRDKRSRWWSVCCSVNSRLGLHPDLTPQRGQKRYTITL